MSIEFEMNGFVNGATAGSPVHATNVRFEHTIDKGYPCWKCGALIGNMQVHYCPNLPTSPWIPPPVPMPPYIIPNPVVTGRVCICGTFVPDGAFHQCPNPNALPKFKPLTKKPFTCPKCNGKKKVNGKNCEPCDGTGIVWG